MKNLKALWMLGIVSMALSSCASNRCSEGAFINRVETEPNMVQKHEQKKGASLSFREWWDAMKAIKELN